MKLLILNGANLNLLGKRENSIYGDSSFEAYYESLKKRYSNHVIDYFQSNIEGEIVNAIQGADRVYDGIIINAGGYTHTSVVIADAIRAVSVPVVEVHISNILAREEFRHVSLIAPVAKGSIFGFGLEGYRLAIESFGE
ncbi:type II 3-dehydroquinate dehydratase [Bacteroidales bacterium OttesenSCG-928-C19]|nr:type II 3-dehydroquinate dehydratase [Bacteroidales bacterium OttesenSCG-928-C19]